MELGRDLINFRMPRGQQSMSKQYGMVYGGVRYCTSHQSIVKCITLAIPQSCLAILAHDMPTATLPEVTPIGMSRSYCTSQCCRSARHSCFTGLWLMAKFSTIRIPSKSDMFMSQGWYRPGCFADGAGCQMDLRVRR